MLPLNFLLLLPIAFATEREWNFGTYIAETENSTLKNVKCTLLRNQNELNLSNLGLKNVAKKAFANESCSKILKLNLNNNWLSTIPPSAFKDLPFLRSFSIANNEIADIAESTFANQDNQLKSIDISHNRLTQLKKHQFFVSSEQKSHIYTQGNNITNISTLLFTDPKKYQYRDNAEVTDLSPTGSIFVQFCLSRNLVKSPLSITIHKNQPPCKIIESSGGYKPGNESKLKNDTFHCQVVEIQLSGGELNLFNFDIDKCITEQSTVNESLIKSIIYKFDGPEFSEVTQLLNDAPEIFEKALLSCVYCGYENSRLITNKHIRELIFENVAVKMDEPGLFRNMNLSVLNLHGTELNNLTFVATLPSTITELYLSKNNFAVIPAGTFSNFNHLLNLGLNGNGIGEIEAGSLHGFSSLQFLDLSDNYLMTLEPGTFQDLASLKYLNLRENRIHLYRGIFTGLESIEVLNVADNALTEIMYNTLYAMPDTLKTVILDGNDIMTLNKDSFVRVPKHTLSLAGNKIEKINKGSFNLPTLKRVSLAKNNIVEVHIGSLWNLEILDLSDNPIKRLDHGSLFGLSTDKECIIKVSGTPIEFIDGRVFEKNSTSQFPDDYD